MATKTVSLKLDAYERLRAARSHPGESLSQVIMRAGWAEDTITAGELLRCCRDRGPLFSEAQLDRIEELNEMDAPPEEKWRAL